MATKKQLQLVISADDQASKKIKQLDNSVLGLESGFNKFNISLAVVAGGIGYLGKKMVDAAAGFEQTQIAFNTMLGSAEIANTLLRDLAEFAAKTPFQLKDVEKGARSLLAFGIEANKILPTLKSLGDVSAGLSVPMERLVLNFGQVKAQAKLTGRELRDFAIAGVPILDELAKNLGKSKAEISDLVSKGKIGFAEVEDAFRSMSSAGGRFYDLMDKQSKTFLGRISNLQDSWDLFLRGQGSQLIVWAGIFVDKLAQIVDWLRRDAEGLNLVGQSIFGLSLFFKALAKTVFSVFLPIAGMARLMFETAKVGMAFVKDMINGFQNLGQTLKKVFSAMGEALRGNFKQAGLDLKGMMKEAVQETTAQMESFDNVLADVTFGIQQGFKDATDSWVDFSQLDGFTTVIQKFGVLGGSIKEQIANAVDKGGEELKKLEDAFAKLQDKIQDVAIKSSDALLGIAEKVKDLQKDLMETLVGNVKDNLGVNQEMAQAYVDQEQKIADLKKAINEESDFAKRQALKSQLNFEEEELAKYGTVALAFENEIEEVRRRNSLSDIARAVEDANMKRNEINKTFSLKFQKIQQEIDAEKKKFEDIKKLQEIALVQSNEFLNLAEDQTAQSIARQIAMYNELATAITRAAQGKISNTNLNIPGRATGGAVNDNSPYIVGENGPELFIPKASGVIRPNLAGAGLGNITINITGNEFVGEEGIADRLGDEIMRSIKDTLKL